MSRARLSEFDGIELVASPDAAGVIVVAGPAADTDYPKLDATFKALMGGTPLVAMQRNRWWPTLEGPAMDAGGIVAALEYAAEVEAVVVAKPSPGIFEVALAACGAEAPHAVMVGDDLVSDLAPARAIGMRTCLVRTGKGSGFSPGAGRGHLRRGRSGGVRGAPAILIAAMVTRSPHTHQLASLRHAISRVSH